MMRTRPVVMIVALVGMSLAWGACESCKKKPAPVEPEVQTPSPVAQQPPAPVDELVSADLAKVFENPRTPASKRLGMVRRIIQASPSSPLMPELKQLEAELDVGRTLERPLRHVSFLVGQAALSAQRELTVAALEGKGWMDHAQQLLFELTHDHPYAAAEQAPAAALRLVAPAGQTLTSPQPVYFGLGLMRQSLVSASRGYAPDALKSCQGDGQACDVQLINAMTTKLVGAPLYKAPGVFDPKGVAAILAQTSIVAEGTLLGQPTLKVMAHYKADLEALARTHHALTKARPAGALLKEYKAAAASGQDLIELYRGMTDRYGIAATSGLKNQPYQAYTLVGFWVRRMADGTEPQLVEALKRQVQLVDAALYAQLYGAR